MNNFDQPINKKLTFTGKYTEGEQKRRNPRIPVEIKGSYVYMDSANKIVERCLINSLSTGGVSFYSNVVLLKGDTIVITFPLDNKMITADCKVTRTHGKEVGSKFIQPTEEIINIIQQYIFKKIFT